MKNKYEGYVVGSDQCWRPSYNNFILAMFLNFVEKEKDIKRVTYAASFGSDRWEIRDVLTPTCVRLAKLFDIITVCENSGVALCEKYLGVKAHHVLYPTMLLTREDYEDLVAEANEPQSEGNLFHYILDPSEDKTNLINHVAKEMGLTPFTVMPRCQAENRSKDDVKNHFENCVFPSVTKWFRGFMDARIVIVDSFHGAVFSIIFNKPFWVIGNKGRGNARFDCLLGMYGLEERFITDPSVLGKKWSEAIGWEKVNSIRNKETERSVGLLSKGLEWK